MKVRQVYWRRKKKKIIAEGKKNNKTIYLFTLPEPDELLRRILEIHQGTPYITKKKSIFSIENIEKNLEIIRRLDFGKEKSKK